ncbi:hypothetical protein cypCar_00045155 [Cyprinus carpio]|nr:hypothetical protein cypCar_00045155 [Cyprinus carpio]
MFHTRYTLHRQALQHKIGYIIDVKITESLVKANDKLSPDRKISDAIDNMQEYTKLTDHIFDQILNQSDSNPDLAEARSILEDVVNRRLPKFVGEARLKEKDLKEKLKASLKDQSDKASRIKLYQEKLQKQWREIITDNKHVNAEDFDIYVLDMGFGEVGKEPIDNVHFYSKNEPNKAFKLEKYQVSSLKPKRFHEYLVRVYYKKTDGSYQKIQQKAEKRFHEWCENNEFIDSEEDESVGVPSQNNQSSDKVADNVYDMFRTQYTLYSQAYQHKIGNISQKKIIDALLEARDKLPKISPIAVSKLQDDIERKIRWITGVSSHTHEDDENSTELNREMREFAKLTDHIFEEILYSSDVGLEGARKKLEDVVKRRLPKCVGETRLIKRDNLDHKKALNQTLQVEEN